MSRGRKTDFTKSRASKVDTLALEIYNILGRAENTKDLEVYYRDIKLTLDTAYVKAKYVISTLEGEE